MATSDVSNTVYYFIAFFLLCKYLFYKIIIKIIFACIPYYKRDIIPTILLYQGVITIYNNEVIAAKLNRWDKYITEFHLPTWDELPDFELYMDQVISLVGRFLDLLPRDGTGESVITPSTINNYVRMKIMPAPVKKKYTRIHLAYLIIICSLKQSLSISVVSRIIPMNISDDAVKEIYDRFVLRHRSISVLCAEQVKQSAAGVFDESSTDDLPVKNLVMDSAIYSNLYKLLTEKLVALEIRPEPETEEAGE